jgi:TolA-binding protein
MTPTNKTMSTPALSNEISSLNENIKELINVIQNLRKDLEKNRVESESLRFRLSELESAMDRN